MGHSTSDWAFVLVVIALLIWVGAESWRVEHTLEFAPPNSETVRVIGQQWFWSFQHADGTQEVNELHLKANVPYRFELVSNDVIHDFAVPDFAILMDVVPGRVNSIWNVFDKPGQYLIECREYCGQGHQQMRAKLFVEPNDNATAVPSPKAAQASPLSQGTGAISIVKPGSNSTVTQGTGVEKLVKPADVTPNSTSSSSSSPSTTKAGSSSTNTTSSGGGGGGGPSVALSIPAGASTQGNPSYDPTTLTVKKGDVITVTNNDNTPHTVTNGASATDPQSGKLFDTSIMMPGKTAKINTSNLAPGDYPFHCTVHPYMNGKLTVKA
jgi:cytochrome c oxidase subunit 2